MTTEVEIWQEGSITATPPKVEPMPESFAIVLHSLGGQLQDKEQAETASQLLKDMGQYEKQVKAAFDEHTKAADRLHKFLTNLRGLALAEVNRSKDRVKSMLLEYQAEQDRRAAEERRRILREAEERAREEKRRAEEAAMEEALRKAAENPESEDAFDMLEQEVEQPVPPPPPVYIPPPPKVAGVTIREVWKYRVTNLRALSQAVGVGVVPTNCVMVNDVFMATQARAIKGQSPYPGVEFYCERVAQSR